MAQAVSPYAWLQLAADTLGAGYPQNQADFFAASLSPSQLDKAHDLYRDFKQKYSTKQ